MKQFLTINPELGDHRLIVNGSVEKLQAVAHINADHVMWISTMTEEESAELVGRTYLVMSNDSVIVLDPSVEAQPIVDLLEGA